jgi:hypothetical protein
VNAVRPILITGSHPLSASLKALAVIGALWLLLWAAERVLFPPAAPRPVARPARGVDTDRWGPRPAVMTRCVECGRNEWPACRCALAREGIAP